MIGIVKLGSDIGVVDHASMHVVVQVSDQKSSTKKLRKKFVC